MKKGIKKPKNSNKKDISIERKVLFSYEISHLQYKDKIRFYYALKGRDGKSGILKKVKAEQLSKGVILIPLQSASEFQDFLNYWNCKFRRLKIQIEDE